MGEVLGLGMTHAPMFQFPDEHMADILRRDLKRDRTPPEMREVRNWPAQMRQEWGDDEGLSAARHHREAMVAGFRRLRAEVDAFKPDFVLIWGDDQYENFREDIIPPFCVYIYDELECFPYRRSGVIDTPVNVWGKPEDGSITVQGHRTAGNYLARNLIQNSFDVAYAFKPLHHPGLGHAFMRTLMYLDYDQRGFPYPIVPFHVNCYGSDLMRQMQVKLDEGEMLPPAPSPQRCFDLGRQIMRLIEDSPWRAVVIGSSSWSHAFLTRKNHGLYPDVESDRVRFGELKAGRQTAWRDLRLDGLVDAGQHELLNWICLAGAMGERTPEIVAWEETYIFNSDKCAALFKS